VNFGGAGGHRPSKPRVPSARRSPAQLPLHLAQAGAAATGTAAAGIAQYALAKLNVPQAHRLATGEKVLVAVIDSGIDMAHPEIEGLVADSYDPLDSAEPAHDHGTAMAGAIIAHGRLTGISPAAHILAIRAFDATGAAAEGTTLTLLRSIDWAVSHGARVINMSFAGPRASLRSSLHASRILRPTHCGRS